MNKLYITIGIVALLVLGFHDYSQTKKLKYTYEHPQVREVIKTVTKTNVVTKEVIVHDRQGNETITRTTTDTSVVDNNTSHLSSPVFAPSQRNVFLGAGIDLEQNKYLLVGGNISLVNVYISHKVLPLPDKLNPTFWASWSFSY